MLESEEEQGIRWLLSREEREREREACPDWALWIDEQKILEESRLKV